MIFSELYGFLSGDTYPFHCIVWKMPGQLKNQIWYANFVVVFMLRIRTNDIFILMYWLYLLIYRFILFFSVGNFVIYCSNPSIVQFDTWNGGCGEAYNKCWYIMRSNDRWLIRSISLMKMPVLWVCWILNQWYLFSISFHFYFFVTLVFYLGLFSIVLSISVAFCVRSVWL